MNRRRLVAAALAALCVAVIAPAAAFQAVGCAEQIEAIASVRDAAGRRGHCDFVVECTAPTCVVTISVASSGIGVLDGEIAGAFGVMRCPPANGGCRLSSIVHIQSGFDLIDCSVTGVAIGVEFSCAVEPATV
ncbi:MAG: hypothetical protein ACRDJM_01640 [Actinomycetota bacterium]